MSTDNANKDQVIVEEGTYGLWVRFPNGRSRFALRGSEMHARLREGGLLNLPERDGLSVTYWRGADGHVEIPADPSFAPPADCAVETATTLPELDRLGREMGAAERRKWEGSAEATEAMERGLGSPRQALVDKLATGQVRGNLERDVIRLMIADLDEEERDRQRISCDMYFRHREYEGNH